MMSLPIFLLGVLVTGMTIAAVLMIGIDEAGDVNHSREEDLSAFERAIVDRSESGDSRPRGR